MSGHWAALTSASIIAALYGGMAAVSRDAACSRCMTIIQSLTLIHAPRFA